MLLRRLLILLTFVIASANLPTKAYCRDYEKGVELYKKGRYKKAKKYLVRGMKKSRDKYEKALHYKIIGLVEYELGSKSKAKKFFKKAVRLDPALNISRRDSSNRGAIALFKKTKKKASSGSRGSSRGRASFRSPRRQRRMSSSGQASAGNPLTNLAPFGIGQFVQGKMILGAGIAAGQAFGLFLFFERNSAAEKADQDALTVIQQQEADPNSFVEEEFNSFIDQNEAFVVDARQQSQTGLLLFAAIYGAGVLEAFLNPPVVTRPRSRGRRRARLEIINDSLATNETLESVYYDTTYKPKKKWEWSLKPIGLGTGLLSLSHNF